MCFKTDLLFFFVKKYLSIFYLLSLATVLYIFFYFLKLQNFFNSKLSKKKMSKLSNLLNFQGLKLHE